jgi:cytochrome c2
MGKLERSTTLAAALMAFLATPGLAAAETGESIFKATCSACHTIGGGRLVGPDLEGVSSRRDADWLGKFIKSPKAMLDSGDAATKAMVDEYTMVMPDQPLSDAQVKLVVDHIDAAAAPAAAPKAAAGKPSLKKPAEPKKAAAFEATPAQIELGQNLFQGTTRFVNGGPPCNSCHDVTHDAIIGGGVLAKELTSVFGRLGEPGVRAILGSPPFPVMGQAYADAALEEKEVVALVGFLQDSDRKKALAQPRDYGVKLAATGGVGVIFLLGFYTMLWGRRKKTSVYKDIYDRQIKSSDL